MSAPSCGHNRRSFDSVLMCLECDTIEHEATGKLKADNERLRGLIKQGEWFGGIGYHDNENGCPWCESDGFYSSSKLGHGKHMSDCPAFTSDGVVR